MIHPVDAVQTLAALADAIANRERFQSEFRVVLPGGRFRWLSSTGYVEIDVSGEPARVCGMSFDITERKEAEEQISVLARHDGLTGLANRTSFQERFVTEMAGVRRRQASFALLCLDLDRFKAVNDTLGHLAGDALLLAVAERIKAETGLNDLVARIGGDEFVIIQSGAAQAQVASALAERIIRAIAQPVSIEGRPVQVGVSIGIALAPNDGCSCHDLYKSADGALYRAKHEGRNTFRFAEATATEIETRLAS